MKLIIRATVVALVLTGAAASTQTSAASTKTTASLSPKVSLVPIPACPPDDPNACGMGQ